MLLVRTILKMSSIAGVGLFADQLVEKGTVVWRFEPAIDIRLSTEQIDRLTETSRDQILKYSYREKQSRLYVLCGDDARFFNHSDHPNCIDLTDGVNITIARRDIECGEEMTCNYALFDLDYMEGSRAFKSVEGLQRREVLERISSPADENSPAAK